MTQHLYQLQKNLDPQQTSCIKVLRKSRRDSYSLHTFPDQKMEVH